MTRKEFRNLVDTKIVILDGATGSNLQHRGMPAGVCPEQWIMEHGDVLIELQREFLEAGSDILFAPTFTANRIKLEEYGLQDHIEDYNKGLIGLSREAVRRYQDNSKNDRKVFIAADITMTGAQLYPVGELTFEELVDVYKDQILYILSEGVDLFVVETMMSLQECRAALLAIKESCDLPIMVSLTFNENMRTFYGTDPKSAIITLQSMGADAVGVNCSAGPDKMIEIVRLMKEYAYVPVLAKPNAGIPKLVDNKTVFPMEAEEFSEEMIKLVEAGASIVGGCCGSTPEHIRQLAEKVCNLKPPTIHKHHIRALTTERKTVEINLNGNFMIVGERINPTGKKALQKELRDGTYDIVCQMAEEQEELGANILDLNVGMNGIDEKETMLNVMEEVISVTGLPLSIDSSHVDVIEAALRLYPGRALINSISLETEKFEKLIPIAKKYGAMFILLPLSDQGLPKDLAEKKQIIHTILDRAYEVGMTKEDIIVDGLVTTVGANPLAALETIETIRYCKEELELATIVGLSNISFGLPERQFINSTFLSFAIQAGLTMAIANPSQDLLMNTAFAADLLLAKEGAAVRYIERVTSRPTVIMTGKDEGKKAVDHASSNVVPVHDVNQHSENNSNEKHIIFEAVLKGNQKNILTLVQIELEGGTEPSYIIDQLLIPAINEVGSLFDRQIYFLPQLIASAEAMKIAIDYLEPKLQNGDKEKKHSTIIIATVAGDIHDIGKNLVALMLRNYGFRVIDLGKDVPTEEIIRFAKEEAAEIIALSALMTTTMVEMKKVVQLAKEAELKSMIIIGGAVITQGYADEIGADGYSADAQNAVGLVKRLLKV